MKYWVCSMILLAFYAGAHHLVTLGRVIAVVVIFCVTFCVGVVLGGMVLLINDKEDRRER